VALCPPDGAVEYLCVPLLHGRGEGELHLLDVSDPQVIAERLTDKLQGFPDLRVLVPVRLHGEAIKFMPKGGHVAAVFVALFFGGVCRRYTRLYAGVRDVAFSTWVHYSEIHCYATPAEAKKQVWPSVIGVCIASGLTNGENPIAAGDARQHS